MTPTHGQRLSHYRLLEKLGEGGMGVVWKAEDTILSRTVAIKVLPAEAGRDESRRGMFLQEAKAASAVSDARIAQVYEIGRDGDLDFIVMEYVDGKPLSKILHGRPLPPDKVASIGAQVAKALARAHKKGLLHRDLKPANVLVTAEGEVKVVDFGLAALFEQAPSRVGSDEPTRTETSEAQAAVVVGGGSPAAAAGTLPYMAPEQVRSEPLDPRSDIFSLGVVLYEMTTGQRPFTGATHSEVVQEILRGRVVPVHERVPKVPLDLDRMILKALAPKKTERYQTMGDLAVDLRRLSKELESGSSPSYEDIKETLKPERRRRARRIALGAVTALAILATAGWLVWPQVSGSLSSAGTTPGAIPAARTVMVLPFDVRGPQETDPAYVGRAVAETIAVNLAQAEELKVLPVPAREAFPPRSPDLASRVHATGAGRWISGTVVRDESGTTATVQLLDAAANRVVWGTESRSVDADLTALVSSLAREAARKLGAAERRMYPHPSELTGSPEMAGSADLAAVIGALRRDEVEPALAASARLVRAFPGDADAWALRANALNGLLYNATSQESRRALADAVATLRALDPDSPYPDWEEAFAFRIADGKPRESIARLDTLLARTDLLPPLRAAILRQRAVGSRYLGDYDAALEDALAALRIMPTSARAHITLASVLRSIGRYEETLSHAHQAVALRPAYWEAHQWVGLALLWAQRFEEAVEPLTSACRLREIQEACALLAITLHRAGREDEARARAKLTAELPDSVFGQYNLACVFALQDERVTALAHLRRSLQLGFADLVLKTDPDLISLHGDPEFEAIVAEVERRTEGT